MNNLRGQTLTLDYAAVNREDHNFRNCVVIGDVPGGGIKGAVRKSISWSILLYPLYFGVLVKKFFLSSFYFFEFTITMFSSLLSTLYILNTSTSFSRPFQSFYKVYCSADRV